MLKFIFNIFFYFIFCNQAIAELVSNKPLVEINNNGYLQKNSNNFYDISIVDKKNFTDFSNEIVLIYLPGSTSDDLSDSHCSVKSEFFSLIELIKFKPKNKNINLYLLCSHLLFGEQGYLDGIDQPYIYPGKSKHVKYRENIKKKIQEFIEIGFKPNNIFLIGHSCGAWHGLHLLEISKNFFNSTIAISPACFGPRSLWKKRPNLMKRRESEISFIKKIKKFSTLIFLGQEDLRENTYSLKEIININMANFIQLPNKNSNGVYYVNGKVCTWHKNNNGAPKWFILDPHNINFSRCFVDYTNDIINFINQKIK